VANANLGFLNGFGEKGGKKNSLPSVRQGREEEKSLPMGRRRTVARAGEKKRVGSP